MHKGVMRAIRWVPNNKYHFLCAFPEGCLLVLDRRREDHPNFPLVIKDNKQLVPLFA
jgi:hypothetical protein